MILILILVPALVVGAAYLTWIKDWKDGVNIKEK